MLLCGSKRWTLAEKQIQMDVVDIHFIMQFAGSGIADYKHIEDFCE